MGVGEDVSHLPSCVQKRESKQRYFLGENCELLLHTCKGEGGGYFEVVKGSALAEQKGEISAANFGEEHSMAVEDGSCLVRRGGTRNGQRTILENLKEGVGIGKGVCLSFAKGERCLLPKRS